MKIAVVKNIPFGGDDSTPAVAGFEGRDCGGN